MSRQRDKIIKALRKYNFEAKEIDYMRPHGDFEMSGQEGGWLVETVDGRFLVGLDVDQLIECIEFEAEFHPATN